MNRNLSGGRCLNVIWDCDALSAKQKLILHYLASQLSFKAELRNTRWFLISTISKKTNIPRSSLLREIQFLETEGYITRSKCFEKSKQTATDYALTDKIFMSQGSQGETPPVPNWDPPQSQGETPPVPNWDTELPQEQTPSLVTPSFLRAGARGEKSEAKKLAQVEREARELMTAIVSFEKFTPIDSVNACAKFLLTKHGIEPIRALHAEVIRLDKLGTVTLNQAGFDEWLLNFLSVSIQVKPVVLSSYQPSA